jgi:broad specificity phosphatase PhoE
MSAKHRHKAVFIARHGNRADFVDPNWPKTAKRPHDPPLSHDGIQQAKKLGKRLKPEGIRHIFASPFLRAVETAHHVAEAIDLTVKIEHGVCEWLNPVWYKTVPDFLPLEELAKTFPRIDRSYTPRMQIMYPEHDEQSQVWPRAGQAARTLAAEFDGPILIVGHGATVLGMSYGFVDQTQEVKCGLCCLVKVVNTESGWKLELNGDQSHLE